VARHRLRSSRSGDVDKAIRLSGYKDAPFLKAERTPVLHAAFDQIAGKGRWRLDSLGFGGMFVVRFPSR